MLHHYGWKDPAIGAENHEGFKVIQFLVGSSEYGESNAIEDELRISAGERVLLDFPSSSLPPHLASEAPRQLAEMLVADRFRCYIYRSSLHDSCDFQLPNYMLTVERLHDL